MTLIETLKQAGTDLVMDKWENHTDIIIRRGEECVYFKNIEEFVVDICEELGVRCDQV